MDDNIIKMNKLPIPDNICPVEIPMELFKIRPDMIVVAEGEGMADFGIDDGDFLFISETISPRIGDIVLATVDKDKTVLRQLLYDESKKMYYLHASGLQSRDDIYLESPYISGVLLNVLKQYYK